MNSDDNYMGPIGPPLFGMVCMAFTVLLLDSAQASDGVIVVAGFLALPLGIVAYGLGSAWFDLETKPRTSGFLRKRFAPQTVIPAADPEEGLLNLGEVGPRAEAAVDEAKMNLAELSHDPTERPIASGGLGIEGSTSSVGVPLSMESDAQRDA